MGKQLDQQQQAAVDLERNGVVSAGAGAGKTTVLSSRYLRIVEQGLAGVDEILTLTFTRKAAAEMHQRIHGRLLKKKGEPSIAAQLARFDRAEISTLDSFCGKIVRDGAGTLGLSRDFSVDEERAKQLIDQAALEFFFRHADLPEVRALVESCGFEAVWKDLFYGLAHGHLPLGVERDFPGFWAAQEAELTRLLGTLSARGSVLLHRFGTYGGGKPQATMAKASALAAEISDLEALVAQGYEALDRAFGVWTLRNLGKCSHPDTEAFKETFNEWKEVRANLKSLTLSLASLREQKPLFDLLMDFQALIHEKKRSAGILSFQDVTQLAVRALVEDPELRKAYKDRFKYIMIDEFQDNNQLQRDLLFLLAEASEVHSPGIPGVGQLDPDKLFFVGDAKQSIYKFRGADVSVFRSLAEELESAGGEALELSTNYRSEPELIRFFNDLFPRVMRDSGAPYEAVFQPLGCRAGRAEIDPRIELHYLVKTNEPTAVHSTLSEAWHVAESIRRWVDSGELLVPEGDGVRPAGYDDIAILMRSTSSQSLYERMLRLQGIPYRTPDVRTLFLEAPASDFYQVLQLCLHPRDTQAYLGFLRSPFVNLRDSVAADLAWKNRRRADTLEETEEELREYVPLFNADGLEPIQEGRLSQAREIFFEVQRLMAEGDLGALLEYLWIDCGYRYFLLKDPSVHGSLEFYDYLLALADLYQDRGIGEFVEFLRENLGKFEKLEDIQVLADRDRSGVQIMTIHKSKGLEFPVCIVANAGSRTRAETNASPFVWNPSWGPSFNAYVDAGGSKLTKANYFFDQAKKIEALKAEAELKRLLYVAVTRAETHLMVFGTCSPNVKAFAADRVSASLLEMMLRSWGWDGSSDPGDLMTPSEIELVRLDPLVEEPRGSFRERRDPESCLSREREIAPVVWHPGVRSAAVTEVNQAWNEIITDDEEEDEFTGELLDPGEAGIAETDFGTICHWVLERRVSGQRFGYEDLPGPLAGSGTESQLRRVLERADLMADRFCEETESLLSGALRLETEVPFLLRHEDWEINGQIDLVAVFEDRVLIVDYKTDRILHSRHYGLQLAVYRRAAEEIFGKPAESMLFYLRFPRAVPIEMEISSSVLSKVLGEVAERVGERLTPISIDTVNSKK